MNGARKAYLTVDGVTERVIADTSGCVFDPKQGWTFPRGELVAVGQVYERWCDVPSAWAGYSPFF